MKQKEFGDRKKSLSTKDANTGNSLNMSASTDNSLNTGPKQH